MILIPEENRMPQHKSAKKRVKTNLKSQQRNRAARSALRTRLKQVNELAETDREQAIRQHQSVLDKAAGSRIIHPNKAARLKSRQARQAKAG
jgi:small subunit ribosomal protein S20